MPVPFAPRLRPGVRLAAAVALAGALVAVGEAAVAAHVAARAALDEAVRSVADHARHLPAPPPGGVLAPAQVRGVAAHEGYRWAAVLGADGSWTAAASPHAGPAPGVAVPQASTWTLHTPPGRAAAHATPSGILVAAPLPGGGELVVALDQAALGERAAATRDPLVAVIVLGGLLCLPLTWLAGGRSLVVRMRAAVHASRTDATTGFPDGRALAEDLAARIARPAGPAPVPASSRWSSPESGERSGGHGTALVLVALRGLAEVADTDGPAARADLARRAAAAAAAEVADADCGPWRVYTLDGDRLAVLVGLDSDAAGVLADRVRSAIGGVAEPLSADVAHACLDDARPDAESVVIAAEQALASARERRALVELFAAVARQREAARRVPRSLRLPETTPGGPDERPGGGPDGEPDIWDLDWLDGGA
ncbi:MAG: hypothetical protein U0Q15_17155 [Kineosporiaceae bacterium]